MGIDTKRVTAVLKTEKNKRVTLDTEEHLGSGGFEGDKRASARTIGIPGPEGEQGPQGEKGDTGDAGPQGLVGLNWMGEYDPSITYQQRDAVSYGGSSYIYKFAVPSTGVDPLIPTHWDVLAGAGTSGDKTYNHVQSVAASIWTINHNLGKFPSVTVVDSGGTQIEGDVVYDDPDNVTVSFSSPFGGKAHLN